MKKRRCKLTTWILVCTFLVSPLSSLDQKEEYKAATSYSNAKEFYESTGEKVSYHAEMINGCIYYATCAKLASSSTNLRYHTIGFDITLSGNGHSVTFTVQRTGGSMAEVNTVNDGTHEYILYAIWDQTLYNLAYLTNPVATSYVLSAPTINVKMDAIMTTKKNNKLAGGIVENGVGGFTQWGTVYRLMDSAQLTTMKNIFSGHDFESYRNINEWLPNYLLQIRYNAQGLNSNSSTKATASNAAYGVSVVNDFIATNGVTFIQNQRLLQITQLLVPKDLNLQKEGYHLEPGKEWMTSDGRIFTPSLLYMPKTIEPLVGWQNKGITMYANWKANTYTVNYHANGGTGSVLPTDFTYDVDGPLRENTFGKTGYKLKTGVEWNTKKDGSGTSYSSGQVIRNLSEKNGDIITLYANWEPIVAKINLDKQAGAGGTNEVYEKYATGFYSNATCTSDISKITTPSKTGHTFTGYYSSVQGNGKQIINANGELLVNNKYYLEDETIFAHFTPNKYIITFDKQGGNLGTSSATATYDEYFPTANGPVRDGYTFKGYYSQTGGKGIRYYNENMACDAIYTLTENLTLYALWADEIAPAVTLRATSDSWTNQKITLTADAIDRGLGLKSIQIYQVASNGTETLVKENKACNGAVTATISYVNPAEGSFRYKAVATDMTGKTAEAYSVVYYDITKPQGEKIENTINGTSVFFKVNITDVKVK